MGISTKTLDEQLRRCGIERESKATRNEVVKGIEGLLRKEFSWSETRMCEEVWQFIGVNVNEFKRHGIEPCNWLNGLELLSDLKKLYWFGLTKSDLVIKKYNGEVELELKTTNSIGAIFFLTLSGTMKTPSLFIEWKRRTPAAKYVSKPIILTYYLVLSANDWSWPIELSTDELLRILEDFGDVELAMLIAGLLDGDVGDVVYRDCLCRDCCL